MPIAKRQNADAKLLRRYADGGDEDAFAEFVGKFKNLVYSTALRRLDSPPLAEDVTQRVFAITARRAPSLTKIENFPAWLHRTATQVASQTARSESRHRRKMSALIEESKSANGEPGDDWVAMHPHLDEALERLPERDRKILLLRYYDGLSFREIAQHIGKSEAAAQRQGHRAVEKLARRMRRSGVAGVTVALLTAGLGTQLTAPAALATSTLASAAIASAPAISTATIFTNLIHTMSQTKTATIAAGAIAIALIPLGMQRKAISNQKRELVSVEKAITVATSAPEATGLGVHRRKLTAISDKRDKAPANRLVDLLEELETLMNGGELAKAARASEFLGSLNGRSDQELADMLDQAYAMKDLDDEFYSFLQIILHDRVARIVPEIALGSALRDNFSNADVLGSTIAGYASVDARAATDWFLENDAAGRLDPAERHERDKVVRQLFTQLFVTDDAQATRLFDSLDDREQRIALPAEWEQLRDPATRDRLVDYAVQIEDVDQRRWALGVFLQHIGYELTLGPETRKIAESMGERGGLSPEHRAQLIVAASKSFLQTARPKMSAAEALEWVRDNSPPEFVERNIDTADEYFKTHERYHSKNQ